MSLVWAVRIRLSVPIIDLFLLLLRSFFFDSSCIFYSSSSSSSSPLEYPLCFHYPTLHHYCSAGTALEFCSLLVHSSLQLTFGASPILDSLRASYFEFFDLCTFNSTSWAFGIFCLILLIGIYLLSTCCLLLITWKVANHGLVRPSSVSWVSWVSLSIRKENRRWHFWSLSRFQTVQRWPHFSVVQFLSILLHLFF